MIKTNHPIWTWKPDLVIINKKKKNWTVDFAVSVYQKLKIRESEKLYKYLNLASGLKKLWNMKALETIPRKSENRLEKLKIRRKIEITQLCYGPLEYWEESWRSEETCWCEKLTRGISYEQVVYSQPRICPRKWDV